MRQWFSFYRFWAIIIKELHQMRRDYVILVMIVAIPMTLLLLFGYAVNLDPKNLTTAVIDNDHSQFSRSFIKSLENSGYFRLIEAPGNEKTANRWLLQTKVQFIINIPTRFEQKIIRGESPSLLVEVDATDPGVIGNALAALNVLADTALQQDLIGPLHYLQPNKLPFRINMQRHYNEENLSKYSIVPGLIGVILTMTMIMATALAITKEFEYGTMENLLAMPAKPLEVMLGKIIPYVMVGYIQLGLILLAAKFLFEIPMQGSLLLLLLCAFVFLMANLSVGLTISTLATNQMQAMQSAFFFYLPSILLTGFAFPFQGMPTWAQIVGNMLPMTHFLRIVRSILLKGAQWQDIWFHLWPLLVFTLIVMIIGHHRYRKTLD